MFKMFSIYRGLIIHMLLVGLVAIVLSVIITPSALHIIEQRFDMIVSYEHVMRVNVGLFFFFFYTLALSWHGFPRTRWVVWGMSLFVIGTLTTFAFDMGHHYRDEMGWIRWWTGGTLLVTSAVILVGAMRTKITMRKWPWVMLGLVFLFAAADELLELHEIMGNVIESRLGVGHAFTDFITLGYAVMGLAAGGLMWFTDAQKHPAVRKSFMILGSGVAVFFVAMVFDTFDIIFEDGIQAVYYWLGSRPGFVFNDFWVILYDPTELFNFLEESLEYLAALLFLAAGGVLFFPAFSYEKSYRIDAPRHRIAASFFVAIAFAGLIAVMSFPPTRTTPLASSEWTATRILGPEDGLYHADDVKWHVSWGILVGNEGGPNVIQRDQSGIPKILEDPLALLTDVDSIAVEDDAVYASDSAEGVIYRYTVPQGWQLYFHSDVIPHPESLSLTPDTMYVVDESVSSVFAVDRATQEITLIASEDDGLNAPEGVLMHSNGTLIVTDDVSGKVWQIRDGVVSPWGTDDHLEPEALHESDAHTVWLTDNRARTVTEYTAEGTPLQVIDFAYNYEDIQGVTTDADGNVYVVTADGYASGSSMPSFVWKLSRTQ